jgi:hypothetical protein
MKCLRCKSENIEDLICENCGHYQAGAKVSIGQKVIYDPTLDHITRVWGAYECYSFYPGMELTIKEKRKLESGVEVFFGEEVKEGWFGLSELCAVQKIPRSKRMEIITNFMDLWQKDKFKLFTIHKGQEVIFRPSNLTKMWQKDNPDFNRLKIGGTYKVRETIERRFVYLDNVSIKIYWKDLEN